MNAKKLLNSSVPTTQFILVGELIFFLVVLLLMHIQEVSQGLRAMTRRSVLLLVKFLIKDEASQDSLRSHTIDGHEDITDSIGKDKDDLDMSKQELKVKVLQEWG